MSDILDFLNSFVKQKESVSEARKLSGFIAHDLSGLIWSPMEVTDETDRVVAGDSEDAI